MKINKTDRLRTRDMLAKTDRFMMEGKSRHDAELLAEAELEFEEEKLEHDSRPSEPEKTPANLQPKKEG
jgi:hypothetical protein